MRQIKFKAKNKEGGFLMFWTVPTEDNEIERLARDLFFCTADLLTVREWSGLTDKNERDIYDGDLRLDFR